MASRRLEDLAPDTAAKFERWLEACAARGVEILVYCTYRSEEEQAELYAQGRTKPGRIVTRARPGESSHQYRRAGDCCPLIYGKPDWSPFESQGHQKRFEETGDYVWLSAPWQVMAEEAERVALGWSGNWKGFREYVHFEDRAA